MPSNLQPEREKAKSPASSRKLKAQPQQTRQLQALQKLLQQGQTVVTEVWNYYVKDWVMSVHAADIDNDGEIEVLLGSRDGFVRILNKWGSLKWENRPGTGKGISSVIGLSTNKGTGSDARVIVGSRDGNVYALDPDSHRLIWQYSTGDIVHQIYIHPQQPDIVIVASEDRCIHVLDRLTGKLLWIYRTEGSIRSIFSFDIDDDGKLEILASSQDTFIYVLSETGQLKNKIATNCVVYSLCAAKSWQDGVGELYTSSNNKDLSAWRVTSQQQDQPDPVFQTIWSRTLQDNIFQNRINCIIVADINNDGQLELILGSDDSYLYILDQAGQLLWKHQLGDSIKSVCAMDIDFDGVTEIIVGLEVNDVYGIHVFRVELIPHLYTAILEAYNTLKVNGLSPINYLQAEHSALATLLSNLVKQEEEPPSSRYMELHVAEFEKARRNYKEALTLALMLEQQRVQHYWRHPYGNLGHISALTIGDLHKDPKDEIIIGNDEGEIIVLDIDQDSEKKAVVWRKKLGQRILALQAGTTAHNDYDSILAVRADQHISVLDNKGLLQAQDELTLMDENDLIWSLSLSRKHNLVEQIVLGTENNRIYIYDAHLKERQTTIHTPAAIKVLRVHDINDDGEIEVIAAGADNTVYVYTHQNALLWQYPVLDRIHALCIADIDGDGQVEILLGSEDRNVYVLDNQGLLKWRYYVPNSVLDVAVHDIDQDGMCEILLGVADGYMYVLNAQGDLLWRYRSADRVQAVHAKDLNDDGQVEILLASEDRLSLLQMLETKRVEELIRLCWNRLSDFANPKETLRKYARREENEYLHAFALKLLSEQPDLTQDDFNILYAVLLSPSLIVKAALVTVIVNLCQQSHANTALPQQVRQIFFQLFAESNREIRLSLVNILPTLIAMDATLGFDYLERFTLNIDIWVRRALVRQLYSLSETAHSEQVFRLLRLTAQDEELWIRQETGRSLAHFFDLHLPVLITATDVLLQGNIDPAIIAQIASSAENPIVRQLYAALAHLFQQLTRDTAEQLLHTMVSALEQTLPLKLPYSELTLLFYKELQLLLGAKDLTMIALYKWVFPYTQIKELPRLSHMVKIFHSLEQFTWIFRTYLRREALGDRAAILLEAIEELAALNRTLQSLPSFRQAPEDAIIEIVLQQWQQITIQELRRLRGQADLRLELKSRFLPDEKNIVVTLEITNQGRSPADNVRVTLQASEEYTSIDNAERSLDEVIMARPIRLDFTIQTHTTEPRFVLSVVYDDAEQRNKQMWFADKLVVQSFHDRQFQEIPNPYYVGLPIKDQAMFYGRQENMLFLKEMLTSNAANHAVMLTGQRRSGKTSLMYQLLNNPDWLSPHIPVLIDMQLLALENNTQQFLLGFASIIYNTLSERGLSVPLLQSSDLDDDPTRAFEAYLERVTRQLGGVRLVLLIDEFEILAQKIKEKKLDQHFLLYLSNLMQHQPGLSFLLAGAPAMRRMTEDYWGVFFNIAHPHKLSKLSPKDARLLIVEPIQDYLEYDPLAVDKMRSLTGDQPYLIHILCETLIRYCNIQRKNYITVNDVNKIVEPVVEKGINYFSWIWNMSTPAERFILAILAQDRSDDNRVFSVTDIEEEYDDYGIPFDREQVLEQLKHLVEGDIIEERVNGTQYRLPVGLIRAWLRQAKPPERVIREEELDVAWQKKTAFADTLTDTSWSSPPEEWATQQTMHGPDAKELTAFTLLSTLHRSSLKIQTPVWSPDGALLAALGQDGTLHLWNAQTGQPLPALIPHTSCPCSSIAWSSNSEILASGFTDGSISLLNVLTGAYQQDFSGHTNTVSCLAWSPNGKKLASGSTDGIVQLWNIATQQLQQTIVQYPAVPVQCIAWSPDGSLLAVGSVEGTIYLWDTLTWQCQHTLAGHFAAITCLAWSPDGKFLLSGSQDMTMRLWQPKNGQQLRSFEGHTAAFASISFTSDGRLLAACSDTIYIWRTDTWESLSSIHNLPAKNSVAGLAFHPYNPIMATFYREDNAISIWAVNTLKLLQATPVVPITYYKIAKIILVGDSGVGKTGLGLVLSNQPFQPTASTHTRNVWLFTSQEIKRDDGSIEIHEMLLWDLAGQQGHRLFHQLHLNELTIALVVFDFKSDTDPFAGVEHWARALKQAEADQKNASFTMRRFLIAARSDGAGRSVSLERIHALKNKFHFDEYIETSAKEGSNIATLQEKIKQAIAWDQLPKITLTDVFQRIKNFFEIESQAGRVLSTYSDLFHALRLYDNTLGTYADIDKQFTQYIKLAQSKGLLRRFNFGDFVLLSPELLDDFASALVNAAREEPDGLGSISEERVEACDFFIPQDKRILNVQQERLLLIAIKEDLLRCEVALREGAYLVFPSQSTREAPQLPDPQGKAAIFHFEGAVANIYATLAVRLSHSGLFQKTALWKNAITYKTRTGGIYGLRLEDHAEGQAEITVFFDKDTRTETCLHFEEYVEDHLRRRALPATVHRRQIFVCHNCDTPLTDFQVQQRRKRDFTWLSCSVCDATVSLLEREELLSGKHLSLVPEMNLVADTQRDYSTAAITLQGKRVTHDFDVFLCYNSKDRPLVKQIGERLQAMGILPWLDEWEAQPGLPWQRLLEKQIDTIKSAAVFVGKDGIGPWERVELDAFLRKFVSHERPVIPVILPDTAKKPPLPPFLAGLTWVDFLVKDPDPLKQLIWGITGERERDR